MREETIRVIAYAGYRAEEAPRAFFIDGRRIEVLRIFERWTEEDTRGEKRQRCFRVRGGDHATRTLCFDELGERWVCWR